MILYSFNFYIYFIRAIFARAFKSFDRMACSVLRLDCWCLAIISFFHWIWLISERTTAAVASCLYCIRLILPSFLIIIEWVFFLFFIFNPVNSNIVYSFYTWLRFPMMAPWNPSSYSCNRSHWLFDGCLSIWFVSNVPFNHLQHFNCLLISVGWLARIK